MSEGSVVQDWVGTACTWKQQTVLLCALRGCDGVPKEDPSKKVTRQIRRMVLHSADGPGKDKFMEEQELQEVVGVVAEDLDHYPVHWVMHTIHAFEIIAYKHPNIAARKEFLTAYSRLVKALHLSIETEQDLDKRLSDGGPTRRRPEDVFPVTVERIVYSSAGVCGYRG